MPPETACLLCFDDEGAAAGRAAQALGWPLHRIERHRFPDGELRLRLPPALPPRVVLWRGLHQPNEKLVELMLVAQGARALGATHLTLVAPYLAYMRQDMAFTPGEPVSQRIVGEFLAQRFDALLTVDPHLHRVSTLHQAVPLRQPQAAVVIQASPLLGDWIATRRRDVLLLGPDEESLQWVDAAARHHGWPSAVCRKVRHGDREVDVALPDISVAGRAVVLMDDVASSGRTLAQATRGLLAGGAASVDVAVTHALFAGDALAHLRAAGVGEVWSTDCIPHETNVVPMAAAVARALTDLFERSPLKLPALP